ncbi:MAG TPA: signal peptide peptidase SppA [bacterium]|nr:signal peptide peptidase SppA [bacterium]
MRYFRWSIVPFFLILTLTGCFQTQVKFFSDGSDPFQEFALEGVGKQKIALIRVQGMITDQPEQGLLRSLPSVVQDTVAQLALAEGDAAVKGVLLVVDTPGGTVTASDMLYHEILRFKERSGKKVVVAMMNMATSGGYFISLPADRIIAHPSTVTGSVGVVFMRPKLHGLMEKIGVSVEVDKSGDAKDAGSPFTPTTPEEKAFFQNIVDELAADFYAKVLKHRKVSAAAMNEVRMAAVFLPRKAKELGLIDDIGYLDEATVAAKQVAGVGADARVVVYRRTYYPNDSYYNNNVRPEGMKVPHLVNISLAGRDSIPAGFYYLWPLFNGE